MESQVEQHELATRNLPEAVPYAILAPSGYVDAAPLPLCVMLMGGGGSRQNLVDSQPLFDGWWSEGAIRPMLIATPTAGMSYYLEDPERGVRWTTFLAEEFVPHLRATCHLALDRRATAIAGMSMGGYGALKTAFTFPQQFGIVAAMHPIIEPGFTDSQIGARNRIHHIGGGPERLIGARRDPAVFEMNHPANLARVNARRIRESGLAIYIEAGDHDFVNAHDGTEFLHRVLWDLDLSHEYHLVRGADHGGPSLHPRMRAMFAWIGSDFERLGGEPSEDPAVAQWMEGGMRGNPPPAAPTSREFLRIIRAQLKPVRDEAARSDPATLRRYGKLPGIS